MLALQRSVEPREVEPVSLKRFCRENCNQVDDLAREVAADYIDSFVSEIQDAAIDGSRISLDHVAGKLQERIIGLAAKQGILIE